MKWRSRSIHCWNYRFALFPKRLGRWQIWFERYAWRYIGARRDEALGWVLYDYELSHPRLGLFQRTDVFEIASCTFVRGHWDPAIRKAA